MAKNQVAKVTFDDCLSRTVALEGGREGGWRAWNTPGDSGGTTFAGLTRKWTLDVPLEEGLEVSQAVKDLWQAVDANNWEAAKQSAKTVYRERIWDRLRLSKMPDHYRARWNAFDAATLYGAPRVARWLQAAAGAEVDGRVGPKTIAAVAAYVKREGAKPLNTLIYQKSLQRNREISPKYSQRFINGWNNRARDRAQEAEQADAGAQS